MGFNGILWDLMGFYGILWDFMGFYGIFKWDFMGSSKDLGKFDHDLKIPQATTKNHIDDGF